MPSHKASTIVLISILAIAGCGRSSEVVFVDPRAVGVASEPSQIDACRVGAGFVGSSARLRGAAKAVWQFDARELLGKSESQRESERRKALGRLVRLLDGIANEAIDRQQARLLKSLEAERDRKVLAIESSIRDNFEDFAFDRGPLLVKFSKLESDVYRNPASTFAVNQERVKAATADLLSTQLQDYLARRRALEATVSGWYDSELTKLQSEIAIKRIRAADDSQREAARLLASSFERAQVQSSMVAVQSIAAIQADSVSVPGAAVQAQLPAIPIASVPAPPKDAVQIWAATHGYTLTQRREAGRDATKEFAQWLKQRQAGR